MDTKLTHRRWRSGWLPRLLVVTVLTLPLLLALSRQRPHSASSDAAITYTVRRKPLTIQIVDTGVLKARQSVTIASQLPSNRGKIIHLVPEGAYVNSGEAVVQFDPAPFAEDVKTFQAELQEAGAMLVQEREESKLQAAKADDEIRAAEHKIHLARLELKNLRDGDGPLSLREADMSLREAEELWRQAQQDYEDLRPLLRAGYITQSELQRARLKATQANNQYQLARKRHDVLVNLRYPTDLERANITLRKQRDNLAKLRQMHTAQRRRAEAKVQRAALRVATIRRKLETAQDLFSKTVIYAPVSGFVIFKELPVHGDRRKVQVGDSVWKNQGFIILPNIEKMMVDVHIREVDIHKLAKGQPALIRVDAYPDLHLRGRVEFIGSLAKSVRPGQTEAKFFNVGIMLEGFDKRLRPGMTARVTIVAKAYPSVLSIPLEAVFDDGDQSVCFVLAAGRVVRRELRLGESNDDYVIVQRGLEAGEKILLHKPRTFEL